MTDSDSIASAVQAVVDQCGSINVLVNNAVQWGELPDETPRFEEVPADQWRTMLRSIQEGYYETIQAGLHGLTNVLAVELAEAGIRSNVVMPRFTLTEHNMDTFPQSARDHLAEMTPTQRLTTPDEVASLIVFLSSQANGHINGEIVRITGGL